MVLHIILANVGVGWGNELEVGDSDDLGGRSSGPHQPGTKRGVQH